MMTAPTTKGPRTMSDAPPIPLEPFEGRPVLSVAIEIPNAAGGLRDAMDLEPVVLHHGSKTFVVLECDVAKVRFDPIKDTEGLRRVHVFNAVAATLVDEHLVREHLDEQARKIETAKRRAKGEHTLDEAAMEAEHADGQHAAGLRPGCPKCDEEAALAAAETGEQPPAPTPIDKRRGRAR